MTSNKNKQINMRLTEAEESKLASMKEKSQMNASQIMRCLLNNGEIIIRNDQKIVIQQMIQMHDNFNIYNRCVVDKIQQIQSIISSLISVNNKNKEEVDGVIAIAEFSLNLLLYDYKNECQRREKELNELVNIQSYN